MPRPEPPWGATAQNDYPQTIKKYCVESDSVNILSLFEFNIKVFLVFRFPYISEEDMNKCFKEVALCDVLKEMDFDSVAVLCCTNPKAVVPYIVHKSTLRYLSFPTKY